MLKFDYLLNLAPPANGLFSSLYDEIVIPQESQIIPAFLLHLNGPDVFKYAMAFAQQSQKDTSNSTAASHVNQSDDQVALSGRSESGVILRAEPATAKPRGSSKERTIRVGVAPRGESRP